MSGSRPSPRILLAVGLLAGSTLALQVLLTRLFAAVLFYHFGFLVISLALLGVGASALAIYVRPQWFDRIPLERMMARWSLAYALLLPCAAFVLVRLDYTYEEITARFVLTLAVACVLAALPFFAAGAAIALAIRGYAASVGRVYSSDLVGAGGGALIVVPLMWLVDVPTLVVALAVVGGLAAALFAGPRTREMRVGLAVAGVACAITAIAAASSIYDVVPKGRAPAAERWTPLHRVLGYAPERRDQNGLVVYDRVSGEVIPYAGGRLPDWRRLQEGPQSIGYELVGPRDTLIIGGGGGRDILEALSEHQRRVDVIELNRGIRDVVDNDLRFSGSPYTLPRVSTAIGDGRSTLARRDRRYNQIHLGLTDTLSSTSGQALALTENNLYTLEAYDEYFDHLRPGGVLSVTRPYRQVGDEALRATVLALEALKRRGVAHPERNVAVILGLYHAPFKTIPTGTVLAKSTPFTAAELRTLRRLGPQRAEGLAYAPGGPYEREWVGLAQASSPTAFCESYRLDVCPPTDDKPFFFHMKRLEDLGGAATSAPLGVPDPIVILAVTLAILAAMSALAFVLPLMLARGPERPAVGSLLFFAAIGLGFLMLEIVMIQRFVLFLGFPTYALSVVVCGLLVWTGLGALLSTRLRGDPRRALATALVLAITLIAACSYGLQPLLRALIDLPFAARVVLTLAMLAPLGLTLGMAMPIGLRRLAALYPAGIPWAWGINGVMSVLASVLAIGVAIYFGFAVTTLVAMACYLGALAHVLLGRWPLTGTAVEPVPPESAAEASDSPLRAGIS